MSFRSFIYYCALCGGWAALLGWLLGRGLAPTAVIPEAAIKGMWLGIFVALALGLVDAVSAVSLSQVGKVALRTGTATAVGCLGGLLGGLLGQALFSWTDLSLFLIIGWTVTGLLVGASVGSFEMLVSLLRKEDVSGALRKVRNGLLGGGVGGLLGGILFLLLRGIWNGLFSGRPIDRMWSPSAIGFVALGTCIGLLMGLTQVFLRVAWVRVEAGFRAGRELLLSRAETIIGRAESCDIGLFGDSGVDPRHALILLQNGRYLLADTGSRTGTYLNELRITATVPLHTGDRIRVGNSVLRFGEQQTRRLAQES
jgi:hypothetical protein